MSYEQILDAKYPTFKFCRRVCIRFLFGWSIIFVHIKQGMFQPTYTIFWTNLSNLYHCCFMRIAISLCPCLSEDTQRHPSISESFVSRVAVLSEFLYMTSFHMTFNSVTHFFGWHVIKSLKMRQNELPHCQHLVWKNPEVCKYVIRSV